MNATIIRDASAALTTLMEISGDKQGAVTPALPAQTALSIEAQLLAQLQKERLEAVVIAIARSAAATPHHPATYDLELKLQQQQLKVESRHPFPVGTRLLLESPGAEAVKVVEVLSGPRERAMLPTAVRDALLEALPRQQPTRETFTSLQRLSVDPQLPQSVRAALDQLLEAIPKVDRLDSTDSLRVLVRNSGLLFEGRIRQLGPLLGQSHPPPEVKPQNVDDPLASAVRGSANRLPGGEAGSGFAPPAGFRQWTESSLQSLLKPLSTWVNQLRVHTDVIGRAESNPRTSGSASTPGAPAPASATTNSVSPPGTPASDPPQADGQRTGSTAAPVTPALVGRLPASTPLQHPASVMSSHETIQNKSRIPPHPPRSATPGFELSADSGTKPPRPPAESTTASATAKTTTTAPTMETSKASPDTPKTMTSTTNAAAAGPAEPNTKPAMQGRPGVNAISSNPTQTLLSQATDIRVHSASVAVEIGPSPGSPLKLDASLTPAPQPNSAVTPRTRSLPANESTTPPVKITDPQEPSTANAGSRRTQQTEVAASDENPVARDRSGQLRQLASAASTGNARVDAVSLQRNGLEADLKLRLTALMQAIRAEAMHRPGARPTAQTPVSSALYTARGTLNSAAPPSQGTSTPSGQPLSPSVLPGASVPKASASSNRQRLNTTGTPGSRSAEDLLLRATESALAKTRLNQFSSITDNRNAENPAQNTWLLEVPLAKENGFDELRLKIEERQPQEGDHRTEPRWDVLISLDIEEIGPLHAQLSLRSQTLEATLWAERSSTLASVRSLLGDLEQSLIAEGVDVERIECRSGKPENTGQAQFKHILDVST